MQGLLVYAKADMAPNQAFIASLQKQALRSGLTLLPTALEELTFTTPSNSIFYQGNKLENITFCINRSRSSELASIVAHAGLRVFNSLKVTSLCCNKFFQYLYATECGVPILPTLYNPAGSYSATLTKGLPHLVAKPCQGHGGHNVILVQPPSHKAPLTLPYAKGLIQQQMPEARQDVRVYVIGNTPVAAVLRTATNDFRANYSLGADVRLFPIPSQLKALVTRLCATYYFDYAGLDFLVAQDGSFYFNEIEDAVGARMLYAVSDLDVAALYMEHIASRLASKDPE